MERHGLPSGVAPRLSPALVERKFLQVPKTGMLLLVAGMGIWSGGPVNLLLGQEHGQGDSGLHSTGGFLTPG